MALTTYIIFEKIEALLPAPNENGAAAAEDGTPEVKAEVITAYVKVDALNAHSTDQALRKAAEKHGSGSYGAVSERHWKTEEFEAETRVVVRAKSAA